jgi:hypothetical protein
VHREWGGGCCPGPLMLLLPLSSYASAPCCCCLLLHLLCFCSVFLSLCRSLPLYLSTLSQLWDSAARAPRGERFDLPLEAEQLGRGLRRRPRVVCLPQRQEHVRQPDLGFGCIVTFYHRLTTPYRIY